MKFIFFLNCDTLNSGRQKILLLAEKHCYNFQNLNDVKLIWILNNEHTELLTELCLFIKNNELTS